MRENRSAGTSAGSHVDSNVGGPEVAVVEHAHGTAGQVGENAGVLPSTITVATPIPPDEVRYTIQNDNMYYNFQRMSCPSFLELLQVV